MSIFCFNAQLPPSQPNYVHFGVENILPSSECYSTFKDSKNNVWFCTDKGLVCFDGYNYKLYNQENGLLNNVVFKLYEDYKHRIWVLSLSKELCYIENKVVKKYKYNVNLNKFIKNVEDPNKNIIIDKDENLYISFRGRGSVKIDSKGFISYLSNKDQHQIQIFNFEDQKLISTNVKLTKLGVVNSPLMLYNSNRLFSKINFEWDPTQPVIHTNNGTDDFIVINNQIYKGFNLKTAIYLPKNFLIFSIKCFSKDKIYIGTNKGLLIYDSNKKRIITDLLFLKGYTITSINQISKNDLLVTTLENGAFFFQSTNIINYRQNLILKNDISAIGGIKNKVIIGYNNFGWVIYDSTKMTRITDIKVSPKVFCNKNYCVLSAKDIDFYEGNKISTIIKKNWGRSFCSDNSDNIYLCARDILRINKDFSIDTIYNFLTNNNKQTRFEAILITKNNEVIVGNLNGLFEIKNNNAFQDRFSSTIFKERVSSLEKYSNGTCIAATRGKGIYFFENFEVLKRINKNNGLLSNDINLVYLDSKNRLWIGSNKGINVILKPNDKYIYQITKKNGLISNEITSFYEYNDTLWIGTKKGLSKIDLTNYKFSKENNTKVTLNSVKINGNGKLKHNINNNYNLKNSENNLEIYFKSNNFNNSLRPTFAFRINDGKWETIHQPQINFINLSYGNYNIEIKHLDENNNWTKPQPLIKFRIDLPYYLKWYSIILYILLIGFLFYIIYILQIKKIKQKEKINKRIKALETKSLSAQMNPHFIFNALNSIQSFIIFGESDKAEHFLTKFAQLIRQTLNNSRTSFITIQNEIDTLKKYIEIEEMRFKNKFTHEFIFENLDQIDFSRFIPPLMIQPFVENSILHAFKSINHNGLITIKIQKVNNYKLQCIIEDNGVGIEKSLESKTKNHISLGSNITQERLDLYKNHHNNTYSINFDIPESKKGTLVYIEIPIFEENGEY